MYAVRKQTAGLLTVC